MSNETWRAIPGWESLYEVSDAGNVRSFNRASRTPTGLPATRKGRTLAHRITPSGHHEVKLFRDGQYRSVGVHRLVLQAFDGPCPEGQEVRHLNDDKADNRLSNLAYGTRSENTFDKVRNGIHPMANRTHCPQGHEYTPENTYIPPSRNARMCRTCRAASRSAA